jgi:hypothetical protein
MPRAGGLVCKVVCKTGPTQDRGVPHAGLGTGSARAVIASVAVSVLTCLALICTVWCIRACDGKHLFRRRGFRLKGCSGTGNWSALSHGIEDAGQEREDSADEDERNGRCEQATNPDADVSHLG